eukprot:5982584-Prymnesium_polylepis.1
MDASNPSNVIVHRTPPVVYTEYDFDYAIYEYVCVLRTASTFKSKYEYYDSTCKLYSVLRIVLITAYVGLLDTATKPRTVYGSAVTYIF